MWSSSVVWCAPPLHQLHCGRDQEHPHSQKLSLSLPLPPPAPLTAALWLQDCPTEPDKVAVLTEMVLPNCEHLGQTIIFVKSRVSASLLCSKLACDGYTVRPLPSAALM